MYICKRMASLSMFYFATSIYIFKLKHCLVMHNAFAIKIITQTVNISGRFASTRTTGLLLLLLYRCRRIVENASNCFGFGCKLVNFECTTGTACKIGLATVVTMLMYTEPWIYIYRSRTLGDTSKTYITSASPAIDHWMWYHVCLRNYEVWKRWELVQKCLCGYLPSNASLRILYSAISI